MKPEKLYTKDIFHHEKGLRRHTLMLTLSGTILSRTYNLVLAPSTLNAQGVPSLTTYEQGSLLQQSLHTPEFLRALARFYLRTLPSDQRPIEFWKLGDTRP